MQPPELLEKVFGKRRIECFSTSTEKIYIHQIKRYIWHFDKTHPKDIYDAEVKAFLTHLAVQHSFSASK